MSTDVSSTCRHDRADAQSNVLTPRHIALLWERMAMIYGHRWTSSYGDKDDGTWLSGLADITPEQIGLGLEKCRTSGDEWPPTLPVFRARCLPATPPSYHRPALRLPRPQLNPETVRSHIDRMQSVLRGGSR